MRMLVLALAVVPACASPGLTKRGRSELEIAGGVNEITDTSGDASSELAGEVLFGYMLNEWAEVGALFAVSRGDVDSKDQPGENSRLDVDQEFEVTDFTWGPVFRANVPTSTPLVPFGEAAFGFGSANVEGAVRTNNVSVHVETSEYVWFYQLGLGARWFVTEQLAVVGLARYRWLDISDVSGTVESVQAMLGLSLTF